MVQSLTSIEVPSVAHVADAFRADEGLLICRLGQRSSCVPFFDIPPGYYALVTKHGYDVDYEDVSAVWPPGRYIAFPSMGVSNLVTQKSVVFDMVVAGCNTKDGVTVAADAALVFRIMGDASKQENSNLVRHFVHMLGACGLEQELRLAQEEEVRVLVSVLTHAKIRGLFSTGVVPDLRETPPARDNAGDRGPWAVTTPMATPSPTNKMTAASSSAIEYNLHCREMKARMNSTFQPQGVQITAVTIKSIEQEAPGVQITAVTINNIEQETPGG